LKIHPWRISPVIGPAVNVESVFIEVKLRGRSSNSAPQFAAAQNTRQKRAPPNNVKPTYLCCDIVKQVVVLSPQVQIAGEAMMSAIAEVLSTVSHIPRGSDLPTCPVCADSMVAAEASAYLADNIVSYLWTCDTCGYGFVTKHSLKRWVCN
jgi:hypothetical protein